MGIKRRCEVKDTSESAILVNRIFNYGGGVVAGSFPRSQAPHADVRVRRPRVQRSAGKSLPAD